MGLANEPDDLIKDMSEFLKTVGFHSSFLDLNEQKRRGNKENYW